MPRKPKTGAGHRRPPGKPFEKGDPRAGRPKGSLNKTTIQVREVAKGLVEDPAYLAGLKRRLRRGSIAPAVETTLWHYAYGVPKKTVELEGPGGGPVQIETMTTAERLARLRAVLAEEDADEDPVADES